MFDARKIIKELSDKAEDNIIKDGSLTPVYLLIDDDGKVVSTIPGNWETDDHKDSFATFMKIVSIAYDPMAVISIVEAWMLDVDKKAGMTIRPSQSERRREIVMVSIIYRDNNKLAKLAFDREIERGADGKVTSLKEGRYIDAMTGRLIDIMPSRRPTKAESEMARKILDTNLNN